MSGLEKDLNSYRGRVRAAGRTRYCIEILIPVLGQTSASLVAASDNDSDMTYSYLDLQKHQLNTRYTSLVLLSSLFGPWNRISYHSNQNLHVSKLKKIVFTDNSHFFRTSTKVNNTLTSTLSRMKMLRRSPGTTSSTEIQLDT